MRPDLAAAFDRLQDLLTVQADGLTAEAVDCWQRAVGIDDDQRATLVDRLQRMQAVTSAEPASVLLGVVLGLFAADLSR